jgi:hypothetical protein
MHASRPKQRPLDGLALSATGRPGAPPPPHERFIGDAFGYHPRGQAVDPVKPPGMSTTTWIAPWLREFGGGGIGIQRSTGDIRHVDTGPRRRWFCD